jgi:hypothetical protein
VSAHASAVPKRALNPPGDHLPLSDFKYYTFSRRVPNTTTYTDITVWLREPHYGQNNTRITGDLYFTTKDYPTVGQNIQGRWTYCENGDCHDQFGTLACVWNHNTTDDRWVCHISDYFARGTDGLDDYLDEFDLWTCPACGTIEKHLEWEVWL